MEKETDRFSQRPDISDKTSRNSTVEIAAPHFSTLELLQQGFSAALGNAAGISTEQIFPKLPLADVESLLEAEKAHNNRLFKITFHPEGGYFMLLLEGSGVDMEAWGHTSTFVLRPYIQKVIDSGKIPQADSVNALNRGWNLVVTKGTYPDVKLYFKV